MIDRFICLDVEMPNGEGNRISAVGITVFENGEITEQKYSLIDPETWFQPYVVNLIGITPEMVEGKPNFAEYWDEIKDILSSAVIVGHGAGNDLKALSGCLKHYNIEWQKEVSYLCTVDACCKMYPDRHAYSLNTLCEEFQIELDHHNALSDSEACGRLLLKCFEDGFEEEDFVRVFDLESGHNKSTKQKKSVTTKLKEIEDAKTRVRDDLFYIGTKKYKNQFLKKNPQFSEDEVIGVWQSALFGYYRRNMKYEKLYLFTKNLPHTYHEENNLHAIIISNIKKYCRMIEKIDEFLPFVDNAETCALLKPKLFSKRQDDLFYRLKNWITSNEKYTVIFGLSSLTRYYIPTKHLETFLEIVAEINREDREIKEAVKKFYSQALAKAPKRVVEFLGTGAIDDIYDDVIERALKVDGLKDANRERIEKLKRKEPVTV